MASMLDPPGAGECNHSRMTYEEAVRQSPLGRSRALQHRRDVCDKHPPREARRWCGRTYAATSAEVSWGELQDALQPPPTCCAAHGVERGDRVAVVLPADARDRGGLLRHLEARARSSSRCRSSTATRASPPAPRLAAQGAGDRRRQRRPLRRARWSTTCSCSTRCSLGAGDPLRARRHRGRRPGPALLHLGHDRAGQGHPARAPLPARPRGVRLLPRRPGGRALPRHGRVGVGGGHRAAARPVAPAARCSSSTSARAASTPHKQLDVALQARGHERVHDADGDAGDDGDRGRRHALPAAVPHRLLGRRAAQPRGDPLVPRAVRRHRARLLRAHRVLSAVRELPVHGGARGLDGPADAGLGRRRSSTRTSGRWRRASAARSACARARTRTTRSATGTTPRPREETFGGEWFHTKDAADAGRGRLLLVRGPRRRRDHLRRLPDRPVRGRVGLHRAPGGARGRRGRLARTRGGATWSRRSSCWPRATSPATSSPTRSRASCASHLSAYAYPRRIEFVDDLPKTLTGKIRRIELREAEREQSETAAG